VALQKLKILYEPPSPESYQAFFVYGDGSLAWQAYPKRPMSLTAVPTCRSKVSSEQIKSLVQLLIHRHFLDLPEKRFIFVLAAQGKEELELHTIAIDDGVGRAVRAFRTGMYAGKEESIPPLTFRRWKGTERLQGLGIYHFREDLPFRSGNQVLGLIFPLQCITKTCK